MSIRGHSAKTSFGGLTQASRAGRRYVLMVASGAMAALIMLCGFYGTLHQMGHLPPPPLSNNLCADEKLVFLRNNPPSNPNLLVIGSSVAWRNFDSSVVARKLPAARPLNGGFCGMQVHQSAFIAQWFIDQLSSIQDVLLIVSPRDYQRCRASGQVFDPVDATKFVFERQWMGGFYLRYFDPLSLARNIREQAQERSEARTLGFSVNFTPYGDKPDFTTRDLFYGAMPEPDPACFAALRSLAIGLAQKGRRFMFVTTPLHPEWIARYDADRSFMNQFMTEVADTLQGTGAKIWDGEKAAIGADGFTDAVHLHWSAAGDFTDKIVQEVLFDHLGRASITDPILDLHSRRAEPSKGGEL
jgi:hypothetical protein